MLCLSLDLLSRARLICVAVQNNISFVAIRPENSMISLKFSYTLLQKEVRNYVKVFGTRAREVQSPWVGKFKLNFSHSTKSFSQF